MRAPGRWNVGTSGHVFSPVIETNQKKAPPNYRLSEKEAANGIAGVSPSTPFLGGGDESVGSTAPIQADRNWKIKPAAVWSNSA